jgi:hypothetical protein
MPKRTNALQQLIALLEAQLAPIGAKVTESALLRDQHTGEDREVDVLIEFNSGIHPIRIGIETIDHSRPASTPWVEQIAKKHEHLGIHRTVLVSRAGFYRPALEKAAHLNLTALTLEDASKSDWRSKLDALPGVTIETFLVPYLTGAALLLAESDGPPPSTIDLRSLHVFASDGADRGALRDIARKVLELPEIVRQIEEKAFENDGTRVDLHWRFEPGSYVEIEGRRRTALGLDIVAKCRKDVTRATIEKGRYGPAAAVLATGAALGHPVQVVLTEQQGKDTIASIAIRGMKAAPPAGDQQAPPSQCTANVYRHGRSGRATFDTGLLQREVVLPRALLRRRQSRTASQELHRGRSDPEGPHPGEVPLDRPAVCVHQLVRLWRPVPRRNPAVE